MYKVMLIDDNEVDAFISKRILTSTLFATDIMEFNCAQKALDYLVENESDENALPQIIFLDVHMPAMNGFDFMEKFEQLHAFIRSRCKIVMLSTAIDESDLKKVQSNDLILKILAKPLSKEQLLELHSELNATISK